MICSRLLQRPAPLVAILLLCAVAFIEQKRYRKNKRSNKKLLWIFVASKFFVKQNKELKFCLCVWFLRSLNLFFVVRLLLLKNVCPFECQQFIFFLCVRSYDVALKMSCQIMNNFETAIRVLSRHNKRNYQTVNEHESKPVSKKRWQVELNSNVEQCHFLKDVELWFSKPSLRFVLP